MTSRKDLRICALLGLRRYCVRGKQQPVSQRDRLGWLRELGRHGSRQRQAPEAFFVYHEGHGLIVLASGFAKRVDEKVATLHFSAFDAELIVLTRVRQIIRVSNSSVLPIAVCRLQGRLETLGCATQRCSWPDSGYMTSVFGGMWNSAVFLREGGPRILHVPLVSGSLHVRRVAHASLVVLRCVCSFPLVLRGRAMAGGTFRRSRRYTGMSSGRPKSTGILAVAGPPGRLYWGARLSTSPANHRCTVPPTGCVHSDALWCGQCTRWPVLYFLMGSTLRRPWC